jgi:hypothetical protein
MNLYTSYFDNPKPVPYPVAISLDVPSGFRGRRYSKLAPTPDLEDAYKRKDINEDRYVDLFLELLQSRRLTPDNVIQDLPYSCTLMCKEKPYQFCHRHIVAKWIYEGTGIEVVEYGVAFLRGGLGIT